MAYRGRRLVRIRIYGIIGFSGFRQLVFDWQALIRIHIGVIFRYGEKRRRGESEIPLILKILILTRRAIAPASRSDFRQNHEKPYPSRNGLRDDGMLSDIRQTPRQTAPRRIPAFAGMTGVGNRKWRRDNRPFQTNHRAATNHWSLTTNLRLVFLVLFLRLFLALGSEYVQPASLS